MYNSETDICNQALAHLGEKRISSLDDDTASARACHLAYPGARDELLREHRWNFAQSRAILTPEAEVPLFGWEYQYPLPADCLRALEVNGSEAGDVTTDPWIIEGRKLLSNATGVNLVYMRQVTNVAQFDNLFSEALALKVAVKISETIRGTTGKTSELLAQLAQLVKPLARRIDANEGKRRKGLVTMNSYILGARRGGSIAGGGAFGGGGGGSGAQGPAGPAGPAGPQGEPGALGWVHRGGFSFAEDYLAGDVVSWLGSGWVATDDIPVSDGDFPGAGVKWGLIVEVGATGATGAAGPAGTPGATGLAGPAGANALVQVIVESTTARSLVLTDGQAYITLTNAASCTITIPTNASVDFAGFAYPWSTLFRVSNTGIPTISAPGVTVNDPGGIMAGLAQGDTFGIINTGVNVFDVI